MDIRDNPEKHRFEALLADGSIAVSEYKLSAGKIIFTHTEVPPEHEGEGIASALVRFALDSARARELEVVPLCPFVAAYMKKHAVVQDLLAPEWRSKLRLA
jgi:hypothetical protein